MRVNDAAFFPPTCDGLMFTLALTSLSGFPENFLYDKKIENIYYTIVKRIKKTAVKRPSAIGCFGLA